MTLDHFLLPQEFLCLELNVGISQCYSHDLDLHYIWCWSLHLYKQHLLVSPEFTLAQAKSLIFFTPWHKLSPSSCHHWKRLVGELATLAIRYLWFSGGPEVRYVILLKWSKISDLQVKGLVEVYHRNTAGAAVLLHREVSYRSISSLNAVSDESISNHEYSNYFRRLLQQYNNLFLSLWMSFSARTLRQEESQMRVMACRWIGCGHWRQRNKLQAMGLTPA